MVSSTLFSRLLQDAAKNGIVPSRSQKSVDWLRNRARDVGSVPTNKVFADTSRLVDSVEPGGLFIFKYDPKTKKDLPYYDTLPVVFPFAPTDDGFLGLNVHYLPHVLRARLMDGLYDHLSNDKMDNSTRLNISYQLLKRASSLEYFKPCVKRYIGRHVMSRFVRVAPKEWELCLFLPLERFEKASTSRVWADSRRMLR